MVQAAPQHPGTAAWGAAAQLCSKPKEAASNTTPSQCRKTHPEQPDGNQDLLTGSQPPPLLCPTTRKVLSMQDTTGFTQPALD